MERFYLTDRINVRHEIESLLNTIKFRSAVKPIVLKPDYTKVWFYDMLMYPKQYEINVWGINDNIIIKKTNYIPGSNSEGTLVWFIEETDHEIEFEYNKKINTFEVFINDFKSIDDFKNNIKETNNNLLLGWQWCQCNSNKGAERLMWELIEKTKNFNSFFITRPRRAGFYIVYLLEKREKVTLMEPIEFQVIQ